MDIRTASVFSCQSLDGKRTRPFPGFRISHRSESAPKTCEVFETTRLSSPKPSQVSPVRIIAVRYYYPTAMILTVGAGPCACPVRDVTCPGSAGMSLPGQGNHGGIAPTNSTCQNHCGRVLQGKRIRKGKKRPLFPFHIRFPCNFQERRCTYKNYVVIFIV